MIEIQSRQNAALKHLARLGRERKYRRSTGEMLCEGEKMLTEALRSGAEIKTVLVRRGFESGELRQAEKQGAAMYCAEDALFCLAERGGKSAERYFFLYAAAVGRSGAR